MLTETEKKFLKGETKLSKSYDSVMGTRIRKKTIESLNDLGLVCKHKDKIVPKTEVKNWTDVQNFCNSVEIL